MSHGLQENPQIKNKVDQKMFFFSADKRLKHEPDKFRES